MIATHHPDPETQAEPQIELIAVERRRRPLTVVFGIAVGVVLLGTESRWPAHGLLQELMFVSGISLATVGALGRTWCNIFISGYKTRKLVESGPYSMCRNPLYFFSACGMVGIGLCSGTLVIPAIMILFFATYYPTIIRSEESRLREKHRDAFLEYGRRTPAFWPRISLYQEPETYVIYPKAVRRNIADTFWFIALAALAHLVSTLHQSNFLPVFLKCW